MSNVAGKAYAMNVLTPMRPRRTFINHFLFYAARALPERLMGLLGLSIIHFARWVIVRRDAWPDFGQPKEELLNDYTLFVSNFNGTWDQYIDAFADGLPSGLDLFWYSATRYPKSIPISAFKAYIRANQIDTSYYYNATPGAAQRDVKAALRVRSALLRLQAAHAKGPDAFAAAWLEELCTVQNDLGSPGFAPVASNDTARADAHRQPLVKKRWGTA
ncbi:hypothetical protein L6Q21_17330 [Sandaracinobacter sp. RS1-74]|uniref:hypothetical protein n=1 Tax=Sandaracinobacteroides sayramensis TaxID=2913411 RepID=UPI001EDA3FD0|nr:hypothetical protein [Sandaracinobacteroides sayramensis]MCG2842741.1 hypothetical protein [Sandaracinobacteroides sayramensis]